MISYDEDFENHLKYIANGFKSKVAKYKTNFGAHVKYEINDNTYVDVEYRLERKLDFHVYVEIESALNSFYRKSCDIIRIPFKDIENLSAEEWLKIIEDCFDTAMEIVDKYILCV